MPKHLNTADDFEMVAIERLKPHPNNVNEADTGAVIESIKAHGFYGALVVQRSTCHVVAGNHRLLAARTLGFSELPVTWITCDDEMAIRLMLTDNRSTRLGRDNPAALAELLAELAGTEQGLVGLGFDGDDLDQLLTDLAGMPQGEQPEGEDGEDSAEPEARKTLAERFGVPPFSVLDARQGYWQQRKRAWLALGIKSELGRGEGVTYGDSPEITEPGLNFYRNKNAAPGGSLRPAATLGKDGKTVRGDGTGKTLSNPAQSNGQDLMRGEHVVGMKSGQPTINGIFGPPEDAGGVESQSGTSIFDPVLCELAYRWFCPSGGSILDPFAGGSVRGVVASVLGREYTGIDLRGEQIEANEAQGAALCPNAPPRWITGDSKDAAALAGGAYDFIFSCPPYADLEVYSNDPADLSTMAYADFVETYRAIIAACVGMLKPDRFACFVVGDVRDKKGFYRNFVGDTVNAFQDAGATLYNEAILVTAVGSLPIRVGKQFGTYRKLGKTHQNVLVFYKGNPKNIPSVLGECEYAEDLTQGGEETIPEE